MANIHFKFGAMNAGKSTQLIQAAFNYKERGMTPLVLKPSIDTRCKMWRLSDYYSSNVRNIKHHWICIWS